MEASVIIATCNRPDPLRQTLEDLAAQTRPAREIIVVDQSRDAEGNPLDQSAALAHIPGLRYIHQREQNAQTARNRAIAEAQSEVLVLVDDDMRLPPGFLAAHLANYENDPQIDAVAGQVLKPRERPTNVLPREMKRRPEGWMYMPLHFAERRETVNWPSCNASVRRHVAIAAGGFDAQFTRTLFDDTDFAWRLHKVGARVVFDPLATAVHLKVPSGGKRPGAKDKLVLADADYWATVFYFWRKSFGMFGARRLFAKYVRGVFCRKVFFKRPDAFAVAVAECLKGWRIASQKLREGPRHGWDASGTLKKKDRNC